MVGHILATFSTYQTHGIIYPTQRRGKNYKSEAAVTVLDQDNVAMEGASVMGDWLFNGQLIQTGASGTTDSQGVAQISSPSKKAGSGDTFRFDVTNVILDEYT
jgi:hypothetical protein